MKNTIIVCVTTAMLFCSCGVRNFVGTNTSTTTHSATEQVGNSAAKTITPAAAAANPEGKNAGAALKALYAQYKIDGKYDYSNLNNIINTISLLENCKQLKSNAKNGEYWKSFASGLVLGSDNLVTEDVATSVTSSLNSIVEKVDTGKIEKAKQNTVAAASTVATCATSVSNLLSLFNGK